MTEPRKIPHTLYVSQTNNSLTRAKIRKLIRSERGAMRRIAAELGINPTVVTLVLQGKTKSARVLDAATARALAILAKQEAA